MPSESINQSTSILVKPVISKKKKNPDGTKKQQGKKNVHFFLKHLRVLPL